MYRLEGRNREWGNLFVFEKQTFSKLEEMMRIVRFKHAHLHTKDGHYSYVFLGYNIIFYNDIVSK